MSTVKVAYEVEPRPRQHPVRKGEDSPCTDHRLCDMCFQVLLLIIFVTTGYAVYRVFHPSVPSYDLGDLFRPKSGSLVTPDVVPSTPTVAAAPVSKGPSKIMERLVREIHRAVDASSSPAPKVAPLASKAADSKAASSASSSEASSSSVSSSEASSSSVSSSEASSSASSSEASEASSESFTLSESFLMHIRVWIEHASKCCSEEVRRHNLNEVLMADVDHHLKELTTLQEGPPYLDIMERAIRHHKKAGKPCSKLEGLVDQKRSKIQRAEDALCKVQMQAQYSTFSLKQWMEDTKLALKTKEEAIKSKLNASVSLWELKKFVYPEVHFESKSCCPKRRDGKCLTKETCEKVMKAAASLCKA